MYSLRFLKCCGQTAYGLAQSRVLCCNGTLYKDIEDGEECSDANIPFNPTKGTLCCSQFHGSPGQHCCGTETYLPHREICCDGHRWLCLRVFSCSSMKVIMRIRSDSRTFIFIGLVCCSVYVSALFLLWPLKNVFSIVEKWGCVSRT